MRTRRRLWRGLGLLLAVAALLSGILAVNLSRPVRSALVAAGDGQLSPQARGALLFFGDDFGGLGAHTLDTHAVPWRLAAAALVLEARDRDPRLATSPATLRQVLAQFGFLFPERIGNWPADLAPVRLTLPLGMTHGRQPLVPGVGFTVANLGCASCHAGVTYDAQGMPRPDVAWLGAPNSSLDLEAYTGAVYRAFAATRERPEALLATAAVLFPEMDGGERFALRHLVMPQVRRRLDALAPLGRPLPYPSGSPGNTNGVAALKQGLGLAYAGGGAGEVGFTSIPDLGHRTWRSSLLYDGGYAVPGRPRQAPMTESAVTPAHLAAQAAITTFFTVPSMGVAPGQALDSIPRAEAVMAFLHAYRPPPFPGPVDLNLARRGQAVYAAQCARCHGRYDANLDQPRLVVFPNWIGDVGTDPARARVFDRALEQAVAESGYRDRIAACGTGLYAAPPLTGLWASAPYLHNGSVPTIAALLEPATRPVRFLVGGHALDFERLGLALSESGGYLTGYRPWSRPVWHDVAAPGRSNAGHLFGRDLSPEDRRALTEYLKRL